MNTQTPLVSAILLAAACASFDGSGNASTSGNDATGVSPSSPPTYVSLAADLIKPGSRLKPYVRTGSDGSQQFRSWWDSELKVECQFRGGAEGEEQCLPTRMLVSATGGYGHFSDSECKVSLSGSLYEDAPSNCFFSREGSPGDRIYASYTFGSATNACATFAGHFEAVEAYSKLSPAGGCSDKYIFWKQIEGVVGVSTPSFVTATGSVLE